MKKLITFISVLTLMSTFSAPFPSSAAEKVVPADIDPAAYEQLIRQSWVTDPDNDSIMTEEELSQASSIYLDLTDVKSIDWLPKAAECSDLHLRNGSFTDLSVIKDMKLSYLYIENTPVEDLSFLRDMDSLDILSVKKLSLSDISFIKDMKELTYCEIQEMDHISMSQRLEVANFSSDLTIEKGFSEEAFMMPLNLFGLTPVRFVIEDTDIATTPNLPLAETGYVAEIYGKNTGTTNYSVYVDDEKVYSGKITVTDCDVYSPELHDTVPDAKICNWYNGILDAACISDGVLYGFSGDKVITRADDVKDYSFIPKSNSKDDLDHEYILKNDGTLLIDGNELPEKYSGICEKYFYNDKGGLYTFCDTGSNTVTEIADDFREFADNYKSFYISVKGELIRYSWNIGTDGKAYITRTPTGFRDLLDNKGNYILDKDHVLWKYPYFLDEEPQKTAENVVKMVHRQTGSFTDEYVYFTEDGKVFRASDGKEITLTDKTSAEILGYKDKGLFTGGIVGLQKVGGTKAPEKDNSTIKYWIGNDNVLHIDNCGRHCSISDAEEFICFKQIQGKKDGYAYFLRTDGSIWQFNTLTDQFREMVSCGIPKNTTVMGDVNGDGEVLVSDLVAMQNWLLGREELKAPEAADLNGDRTADVFDLIALRKKLIC